MKQLRFLRLGRLALALGVTCALGAVGACRAEPPPKAVESEFGVVRAASEASARSTEDLLAELVPRLRELMPGMRDRPVEVWMQKQLELFRGEPFPEHVAGMAEYAQSRIYLRDEDAELKLHLAHELVHLMLGSDWDSLPAVLEEGLCDYAAYDVVDDSQSTLRAWRLLEAGGAFGGIDATIEFRLPRDAMHRTRSETHEMRLGVKAAAIPSIAEVLALDDDQVFERSTHDEGAPLYGVGYFIVTRIIERRGYEGLHALCVEAGRSGRSIVAPDRILKIADLEGDPEALRRAVEAELDPHDLPGLTPLCADVLAASLTNYAKTTYPSASAREFLLAARPQLSLRSSRARLPLAYSNSFVTALHTHW